jgi:hypothetical protein
MKGQEKRKDVLCAFQRFSDVSEQQVGRFSCLRMQKLVSVDAA